MTLPATVDRPSPITTGQGLALQRRLVELGRIRLGEKGSRGEPKKLTKFRLTSASRQLLEAAARLYGGTVRAWQGAPDEGMWELLTATDALDVMVPPMLSAYSQFYEVWDAGGCTLRCDGRWESIAEEPCSHGDHEGMKVTTRVSVILPKLPGLGVWRLETQGWNAAATLPSSLDLIGAAGKWIPAVIRLEQRSSRTRENGRALVRRFVVPVLDVVGLSFGEMLAAGAASDDYTPGLAPVESKALAAQAGTSRSPRSKKVDRPQLADEPELPDETAPLATPVARSFPEEAPAPQPLAAAAEPAGSVIDDVDLAATVLIAEKASDLEGLPTKEQLGELRRIFEGLDSEAVKAGIGQIWDRDAISRPTGAQAAALILVADSLGDRFRPAWTHMVETAAVTA